MVRDETCTEIRGMTVHHCDDCLDQRKVYECVVKLYGRLVHGTFSWLSGTLIA